MNVIHMNLKDEYSDFIINSQGGDIKIQAITFGDKSKFRINIRNVVMTDTTLYSDINGAFKEAMKWIKYYSNKSA